jgi:hypothetical protein
MAVFSDQGVLTAGQKIPARDSESPAEERPEGERPDLFESSYIVKQ